MNNTTDTIKKLLLEHPFGGPDFGGCECGQIIGGAQDDWAAHLAPIIADAVAPRIVTSEDELNALHIGAVIRDNDGEVFEQWATGDWQAVGMLDTGESKLTSEVAFPVTVLWQEAAK